MSKKAFCDVIRQVGTEGDPALTVRPHPDNPGKWVELCAHGEEAVAHWGGFSLALPKDLAVQLSKALFACASELA